MADSTPFDLQDDRAYRAWAEAKLCAYPASPADLRVEVASLAHPRPEERLEILARCARFNMALIRTDPAQVEPQAILAFGRALGLSTADTNRFADADSVSAIAAGGGDGRAEYIPYSTRPLGWHTDGYYNAPGSQVRAWTLFCRRPARVGGENALLDHEIAYLLLRDLDPRHIRALSHPDALYIPANLGGDDGRPQRAESRGPVFSVRAGALHMRWSARPRHCQWRDTPETLAAREALARLFSPAPAYTFALRLNSGEGLVSNNVLHCRTGFEDEPDPYKTRLLYRVRYLERVALPS